MNEEIAPGVPLYRVTDWADRFPWLFAGITHAGADPDPFDLRLFGEPASQLAPGRWRDLLRASAFTAIVHARQVHETRIVVHDGVGKGVREAGGAADGHATADSGVLLAVTVADCVPVYLLAADARAVALLHAGWRGTAAGILPRGIALLGKKWGTDPGNLLVHLGPAICGECYEVGSEVFGALGLEVPPDPAPVDMRAALARQAKAAGVPSESITVSDVCTLCGGSNLFSHRAGRSERQVAVLGIRP
ncbi:MAG: polyphenol oxidase family protein [Gemmatimonadetes bacterium]|nr:polyphenol oxidase family protein [Gemmatimonadota bacterium]